MHLGWRTIALLREPDHYIVKPDLIFTYIVCMWFLKDACFWDSMWPRRGIHLSPDPDVASTSPLPAAPLGYTQALFSLPWIPLSECLSHTGCLVARKPWWNNMPLNMFPAVQNQLWWTWAKLWQPHCLDLAHRTLSGKLLSADHIIVLFPKWKEQNI